MTSSSGSTPEGQGPTQAQVLEWARQRWPERSDPLWRALKLGEEAGEVQGAVVKMAEGRKTLADLTTETAQLVICAMALAESAGFDLHSAITAEWERCR
jgi:NTP pyrophosphatase (non-canonical NTP hydrolase)